ncbi:hypothetical protein [Paenibacillus humicola]|uniref:hypothetical protein n=1 Tax=Paenibacillus humicola TaxID=3110540 RepID=UPI00237A94A3|nr:hypothetical protein [Paenibacillus humicola]
MFINGGRFFPWLTRTHPVRFFRGITIYQALAATGVVRFGFGGRIVAVDGVFITGNIDVILRLNGRRIPQTFLFYPLQPRDTVSLELVVRGPGFPREDEFEDMAAEQQFQDSFEYHPDAQQQNVDDDTRAEAEEEG